MTLLLRRTYPLPRSLSLDLLIPLPVETKRNLLQALVSIKHWQHSLFGSHVLYSFINLIHIVLSSSTIVSILIFQSLFWAGAPSLYTVTAKSEKLYSRTETKLTGPLASPGDYHTRPLKHLPMRHQHRSLFTISRSPMGSFVCYPSLQTRTSEPQVLPTKHLSKTASTTLLSTRSFPMLPAILPSSRRTVQFLNRLSSSEFQDPTFQNNRCRR